MFLVAYNLAINMVPFLKFGNITTLIFISLIIAFVS